MPPAAATAAGRSAPRPYRAAQAVPPRPRREAQAAPPRPYREAQAAPPRPRRAVAAPARPLREAPVPARPRRELPARHREALRREAARHHRRSRELPRLDRIVRGRAWIPVLAVMLFAIVAMRVEVLKLGSSVGAETQRASVLQSSNATLRSQVSELSGSQRILQLAAGYGMIMPGPMDTHFVQASRAHNVGATIQSIHEPDRSVFLSGIANERQTNVSSTLADAPPTTSPPASTSTPGSTSTATPPTSTATSTPPASSATSAPSASTATSTPPASTGTAVGSTTGGSGLAG